jgi:hypothetical protein
MNKNAQFFRKWWGLLVIGVLLVSSLSGCGSQGKVLKIGYITELRSDRCRGSCQAFDGSG